METEKRAATNVPRSPRTKLPKVPQTHRIAKRPLLHAAIASGLTSSTTQPKIIYVSTKSPFVAIIKRAQAFLAQIQKREEGGVDVHDLLHRKVGGAATSAGKDGLRGGVNGLANRPLRKGGDDVGEEVVVTGTGKAIERVLAVALFFQGGGGGVGVCGSGDGPNGHEHGATDFGKYTVRLTTKSIGAIDDVVYSGKEGGRAGERSREKGSEGKGEEEGGAQERPDEHMLSPDEPGEEVGADVPETRLRRTSCLEVHIGLR